ncbi:hypothetical protein [Pirellulimonas nuda]|uniref:hypothetical protein n=1 Tax=Pirellulimonas nuda TaxID=2528009 RepID=UPI0011A29401|nr:hypothetical protein [Pirellulimonas nuda]
MQNSSPTDIRHSIHDRESHVGEVVPTAFSCVPSYRRMAEAVNPYGDGRASGRILEALAKRLA